MTTQRLRDAARKIRDTAHATADQSRWVSGESWLRSGSQGTVMTAEGAPIADCGDGGRANEDAAHIALWSPPVALDAADTLDAIADVTEKFGMIPDAAVRWADRILGNQP